MTKKVTGTQYIAGTNSTRVYYEDGTFDAFSGNVAEEMSDIVAVDFGTEGGFSPSEKTVMGTEIESITTDDNQVTTYEAGNQANGGGSIDGGTSTGVHVGSEPSDSTGISEVGPADTRGDVGDVPGEGGAAGDVPSGS